MIHRRRFSTLAVAAALPRGVSSQTSGQTAAQARPLILANAVLPPFVNPAGHPAGEGIDIEIAREALRRQGLEVQLQLLPWKRALLMLETGTADFTTSISRNAERDRFLAWSLGYRQAVGYRFFARRDSPFGLRQLSDLAGRSLGISAGHYYPDAILKAASARIDTAKDIAATVRLLLAGRVDFIVVQLVSGTWQIREQGLAEQLRAEPYEYHSDGQTYMAFSLARAGHAAALAAMDSGLKSMIRDGSLARIEHRYLGA